MQAKASAKKNDQQKYDKKGGIILMRNQTSYLSTANEEKNRHTVDDKRQNHEKRNKCKVIRKENIF